MPTTPPPPYLTGDHVQILYMSPRGTVLANAEVTVVYPHDDEHWEIVAVLSGPRGEFTLVPARAEPHRPAARTVRLGRHRPGTNPAGPTHVRSPTRRTTAAIGSDSTR